MADDIRTCVTLFTFKCSIKKNQPEANILFYYGQRWPAIHHARIRMGCSLLHYDLCYSVHVIEDPSCSCGAVLETAQHYLYATQRQRLFT